MLRLAPVYLTPPPYQNSNCSVKIQTPPLRGQVHSCLHVYSITEASSIILVLVGARCTDARLYTLCIKIGTRTTRARERSHY